MPNAVEASWEAISENILISIETEYIVSSILRSTIPSIDPESHLSLILKHKSNISG